MLTPEDRAKAAAARRARPTQRQKMAAYAETFAQMRKNFPRFALPIIDKAEAGSKTAAIKLNCLECSGWQRKEVRDCRDTGCPFYPQRPYQGLKGRNPNDPPAVQRKPA